MARRGDFSTLPPQHSSVWFSYASALKSKITRKGRVSIANTSRALGALAGALATFATALAGTSDVQRRAKRVGGCLPKRDSRMTTLLANPNITVAEVAERVGVSPATLYRYLPAARTANAIDSSAG